MARRHDPRCETAKRSSCECSCEGRLHGVAYLPQAGTQEPTADEQAQGGATATPAQ